MKYLVVSDNHGDRQVLVDIVEKYRGEVDLMFHCGDSELEANDPLWQEMIVVRGNCDYGPGFETSKVVKNQQDTIFMTHGHLADVRFNLTRLALLAKEKNANIALFGHTHELGCEVDDGILYLNPGSIRLPRGRYQIKTFAIIDSTPDAYQVTYYDRNFQPVPKLSFKFARESKNL